MQFSSLPTRRSEESFWLNDALARDAESSVSLEGAGQTDVCIVGGGYTGLWTAIELKSRDSSIDVTVLEAQMCGSGASGTNAGFAMNLWPKLPALIAHVGKDEAEQIAIASSQALDDINHFICEHGIDASFERKGWLWCSTTEEQDGAWDGVLDLLAKSKANPFVELSTVEAKELGGEGVRNGILDPTSATVQPAALARGLRRVAIEMGVRLHERTPVLSIEGTGRPTVVTPRGSITADSVVLAINAWASNLGWVRKVMITTASDNFVTGQLGEHTLDCVTAPGLGVSDSRRLLNYWRRTPDDRLLFGKGGLGLGFGARGASSMFGGVPDIAALTRNFHSTFPALASVGPVNSWRAPVEYALNSLPFFIADPAHPRVFVAAGYSGDGVGPSRMGARILASLATDVDDQWSGCGLTRIPSGWVPPEPFRFVGGQFVRRALSHVDESWTAGRRPNPAVAAFTRLDPTSWM